MGIILTVWAMVLPISTFLLFMIAAVARGHEFFSRFSARFRTFFANFAAIKKTCSKNLSARTYVPQLTFLGLLNPEICLGVKPDTQLISPSVNLSAAH